MLENSDRWYAVPAYKGATGHFGQPHVVNSHGELIARCESITDAVQIADDHNAALKHRAMPARSIQRTGTG